MVGWRTAPWPWQTIHSEEVPNSAERENTSHRRLLDLRGKLCLWYVREAEGWRNRWNTGRHLRPTRLPEFCKQRQRTFGKDIWFEVGLQTIWSGCATLGEAQNRCEETWWRSCIFQSFGVTLRSHWQCFGFSQDFICNCVHRFEGSLHSMVSIFRRLHCPLTVRPWAWHHILCRSFVQATGHKLCLGRIKSAPVLRLLQDFGTGGQHRERGEPRGQSWTHGGEVEGTARMHWRNPAPQLRGNQDSWKVAWQDSLVSHLCFWEKTERGHQGPVMALEKAGSVDPRWRSTEIGIGNIEESPGVEQTCFHKPWYQWDVDNFYGRRFWAHQHTTCFNRWNPSEPKWESRFLLRCIPPAASPWRILGEIEPSNLWTGDPSFAGCCQDMVNEYSRQACGSLFG